MITKYRCSRFGTYNQITREEFEKETDKFYVTSFGRKWSKDGQEYAYYDTWEEARDALLARAKHELSCAKRSVQDIEKLRNPYYLIGGPRGS